jgi:hypothetical protein
MRTVILAACLAASATALAIGRRDETGVDANKLFTLELEPGKTIQATDSEKWALRAVRSLS